MPLSNTKHGRRREEEGAQFTRCRVMKADGQCNDVAIMKK
jgi:hypothetical protein